MKHLKSILFVLLALAVGCENNDVDSTAISTLKDKAPNTLAEETSPSATQESFVATVNNKEVTEAELHYLKTLDTKNLTVEQKELIDQRIKALIAALNILDPYSVAAIRVVPRNPPPAPCPIGTCIPLFTRINLLILGQFRSMANPVAGRTSDPSIVLKNNSGKVYAVGSVNSYDPLLSLYWFKFTTINPNLSKESLIMQVETSYVVDGQEKEVSYSATLPPNTFAN